MKRFIVCALCLSLLCTGMGLCAGTAWAEEAAVRPDADALTEALLGLPTTPEPSFQAFGSVTLDGQAVDATLFSSHKLTMVNIWATFCGPCISEMPELATLGAEYADGEVQVVGIVIDVLNQDLSVNQEGLALAWEIVDGTGANYVHLLPSTDLIRAKLAAVYAVPETIFVDAEGNVLTPETQYVGARSKDGWKAIIDGLLAEME